MTTHIFVSHAYDHRKLYNSIVHRLEDRDDVDWYDCSVPRHRRYGTDGQDKLTDDALRQLLMEHIKLADVVIAIAKPVATRREWIRWELQYAKSLGKPIIAVWRRHQDLRVSSYVLRIADIQNDTWRIDLLLRDIARALEIGRERRADAEAERNAQAALTADDRDMEPFNVSTEAVAPRQELALTAEEEATLTPRQVIGQRLSPGRDDSAVLRVELADALRKVSDRITQPMSNVSPKSVIAPTINRRWWQIWTSRDDRSALPRVN